MESFLSIEKLRRFVQRKIKIVAIVMMVVGLALIGWPFIETTADNALSKQRIGAYEDKVKALPEGTWQEMLAEARVYHQNLDSLRRSVMDPFGIEDYRGASPLSAVGNHDIFAYLWIPKLGERLPVYLSVNSKNLTQGVVLVEGTDIPIGEPGTHTVLAGRRNALTRNWLTNIEKLTVGDQLYLYILNKRITYSVKESAVFWPSENDHYLPSPGSEQLSLLTTTPYPINNQRRLVVAEKIQEKERQASIVRDMERIEKESSMAGSPLHQRNWSIGVSVLVGIALTGLALLLYREIKQ
jgi:sortase A